MSALQSSNSVRRQLADAVLMVEPTGIRFNAQTASDNHFQRPLSELTEAETRSRARAEFDSLIAQLRELDVYVVVAPSPETFDAPDAVFPNNWISFHDDGTVVLYPMMAANRRVERRAEVIEMVRHNGFSISSVLDFSAWEQEGVFLEGTGSLVLDRFHQLAFASVSERTSQIAVERWCEAMHYKPIVFHARQTVNGVRVPVYHTNVVMGIGETWAVICVEAIDDLHQRRTVQDELAATGRRIVEISQSQMIDCFAGNLLQLASANGPPVTVISQIGYESLAPVQRHAIACSGRILAAEIPTIEACGGGSVRCMLAEIFLPRSARSMSAPLTRR